MMFQNNRPSPWPTRSRGMTRLRKYVRMARQRRLNFWQARWRTEAIEDEDLMESGPQSFEPAAKKSLNDHDEPMLARTDEDAPSWSNGAGAVYTCAGGLN